MKSTRMKSIRLRWLIIAGMLTVSAADFTQAQIPTLKKVIDAQSTAKPTPAEKPEDVRVRLEQWRQEARDTSVRLDAQDAATLPKGVTVEDFAERRRDLEQMILTVNRSIKNLNAIADARKTLEESRAKDAAWTGFEEKPPYSLMMIDELLNERDVVMASLSSSESSLSNYDHLQLSSMEESKTAEDALRSALGSLQQADAESLDSAKWQLEKARTKSRMMALRARLMQNLHDSLIDRIAASKIDLSLLDRQIKIARANPRFSDDDLTKVAKLSEQRKQMIRKENDAISKRLNAAITARTQAQSAMDAQLSQSPTNAKPADLELAKYRLEVAEERVETLQSLDEGLESLLQLENLSMTAYQNRRAILSATQPKEKAKALESLGILRDRLSAWGNVLDDEIAECSANLHKLETRAASISSDDTCFKLLNEQRSIVGEKLALLQRISQATSFQGKIVKRWDREYGEKPHDAGWLGRASSISATAWHTMKNIWSFEVMSFEDKVEVEGQTITGKIPVKLGMFMRALLFFLLGYWISSKIAKHIEAGFVTRGHIAEAQARTLRNWGMVVVGVFLAIGTLSFLKIPLTVFAFFGGALAIGLGFGMQTLIKNFISGIIVLIERKVRVGDVLDVGGIVGTVTEINTRSSVIRSPDDVETMIPNSLFLENQVTNWTLSSAKMRRFLRVGAAYGTSPQKVMAVLTEVAGRHGLICKDPAPFAVFEDFGESALIFHLYFWLELGGATNAMIVNSDLRLMIEKRFSELGVDVPFPKRDLHLATDQPLQVQWVKESNHSDHQPPMPHD